MTKTAIIGGGPAGVMCALFASKNPENEIYIFDRGILLNTLLPTGGGRCNLAYAQYNFKELAKFYPRGEKFLYGVFSRFSTADTVAFFENIGIKTYTQEDNRIFPVTNSAKDVKTALLKQIDRQKNIKKVFEQVEKIEKTEKGFVLETNKTTHFFDAVVIASGGGRAAQHSAALKDSGGRRGRDGAAANSHGDRKNTAAGQKLAASLGHNIIELRPALSSLITKEKDFAEISGISLKNIDAAVFFKNKKIKELTGDLLFTHTGVSGPLVFKISSYCAYIDFNAENPLQLSFNLVNKSFEEFDEEFLTSLKSNAQKEAINVLSEFLPKKLCFSLFKKENLNPSVKAGQMTKKDREKLSKTVTGLLLNAVDITKGEEIVTAGGVDLKEVDSKTMESKLVKNLYFCGEVLDIDGLTGGFNLQNCWSTGFIAGTALSENF